MRERRRFSAAFKQQVVGELLSGVCTLAQLVRRHDVSSGLILYWKKRSEGGGLMEGSARSEKQYRARIAELLTPEGVKPLPLTVTFFQRANRGDEKTRSRIF